MRTLALSILVAIGCGPPRPDLPDIPGGGRAGAAGAALEVGPRLGGGVARVARVRVSAEAARGLDAARLWLFVDELSSYHDRRVRSGDLPSTLLEREVPSRAWLADDGAMVLAPLRALEPGGAYSVGAAGVGSLGVFQVDPDAPEPLEMLWPPPPSDGVAREGGARWVYCGPSAPAAAGVGLPEPGSALVEPGAMGAEIVGGLAGASTPAPDCLTIVLDDPNVAGAEVVPPVEVLGAPLEPALIRLGPGSPVEPLACGAAELEVGRGCARAEDERVVLTSNEAALWLVGGAEVGERLVLARGARAVVRGFAPATRAEVTFAALGVPGEWSAVTLPLQFGPARRRVVLSEVLANALGAEPAQEWVELVNDGAIPVELGGWSVEDVGGVSVLPPHVLAPGEYAIVVGEGFDPTSGLDVSPAPGAAILVVPKLGKSGLSNSGEPLLLRTDTGEVVSRFPARAASVAGASVGRRQPWSLDDAPEAFGPHAEPGASPGAPNALAE